MTATERVGLKPCPFCRDGSVVMHPRDIALGGAAMALQGSSAQYAHCDGCGAEGPQAFTQREAVAAWNRRPTPPAEAVEAARRIAGGWQRSLTMTGYFEEDDPLRVARALLSLAGDQT